MIDIQLNDVTACYGSKVVFEHASVHIEDHDYMGIVGPNGGGKTTLVRILLGLLKPAKGEVVFMRDGCRTDSLVMGYLPQYNAIDRRFPISVYDVVLSGLSSQKPFLRPFTAAQHRQVADTIREMELTGLEQRPIGQLSGGQLQRVLLARAMVSRPEVLILDEPNTYIDRQFQEQLYQMLEKINSRCTLIVVTHDIASILHTAKHFTCVNHKVHCHAACDMPADQLERHLTLM